MDTRTPDGRPVPAVLGFVAAARAGLKGLAEVNPVFLTAEEKAAALVGLTELEAQVAELRLRILACADDVAEATGARDAAAWLAVATRQDGPAARADQRLATVLDRDLDLLARGLRDGAVGLAQARVIAHALANLPQDLDPQVRVQAEQALVGLAGEHAPAELRRLGRRILEVACPEAAEAAEARLLEESERSARDRTKLTLRPLGDGTTRLSGLLPDAAAHRLATYLHAFTNPRKHHGTPTSAGVGSYPRRLGQAFVHLLETLDPTRLPVHGGDATTVVVTLSLDQLRADLGVGDVIGGERLTAGEIRRLACTAKILPAVLGGTSEVLDLARARRLFTAAQRKALLLRDRTCRAHGCDIPGTWAEAHHWLPWTHGGPTNLDNAVLLCHLHHHRAHDPHWTTHRLPNGDIRYTRRR